MKKSRPFPPMPKDLAQALHNGSPDIFAVMHEGYHLHHAILGKNDVKGMPYSEKVKIHSRYNILKIPASMNASHANIPTKDNAIRMLVRKYGYAKVCAWFESFNWKSKPPFVFPTEEQLLEESC